LSIAFRERRAEHTNCLGNPEQIALLDYLWIGGVFVLRKGWRWSQDCFAP